MGKEWEIDWDYWEAQLEGFKTLTPLVKKKDI